MSRDASLQRLIAAACFAPDGEERLTERFVAFCKEHDVDPRDVEALEETSARLVIYRRLVRGNVFDVCEKMMPQTKERLGSDFQSSVDHFLEVSGPHTHYLRDVPHDVFALESPKWPGAIRDLAAWELAEYAVSAAPKRTDRGSPADLALDKPVLFDDAVRVLDLDHAVHEDPVTEKQVHLLVYRDPEHVVRTLDLTPLAAALVRRLVNGETLGAATKEACADVDMTLSDDLLGSIARLLADLAERGALLGSES